MLSGAAEANPRHQIGRYEVLGALGHGGMAVVYRARDTQLLRIVAVKVLHPHLASDEESRQRFLREAQAAARLRHPNIVEVFDFSVAADSESFMVTELLEGPTLRKFCEPLLPLSPEIVAAIGMVLCDALACAHAQGVVHRDVKPDNVMLHRNGTLKLTDFGIAHVADGNGMTVTGQILGSPAHMAPEQIDGRAVDGRTDLFSLGTVLYLLAVGRLPFDAPAAHALLRKILDVDYPAPLRSQPLVGHRFAAIITRCLAQKPEDRYEDAGALRKALGDFCLETGWKDPLENLKEFFATPTEFVSAHSARMLGVLASLGTLARDRRDVGEALGYYNRALALDPGNAEVLALVRGIARHRRRQKNLRALALVSTTAVCTAIAGGGVAMMIKRSLPRAQLQPIADASAAQAAARDASVRAIEDVTALATDTSVATADVAQVRAEDVSVIVDARRAAAGHRNGHAASVNAAPQLSSPQSVRLIVRGMQGLLSIDGRDPREHDNGTEYSLSVGWHTIQLLPQDSSCARPPPWRVNVEASQSGVTQNLRSPFFSCRLQEGREP
ncbi:MAG: protein kinase [Deltaproteobacteria bacterium]|nr:protein kinase [Deltaproteobacteria bacterium]